MRGRPKKSKDVEQCCENCGKKWMQPEWERPRKFCSRECFYAGETGKPVLARRRRVQLICDHCGKEFEGGGASGHSREARFCSQDCASCGLTRQPAPSNLSVVDAAYLAGFLDGEGSIIKVGRGWRVTIWQSNEEVIRWIADVVQTGSVFSRELNGSNLVKQSNFKLGWYWQLYGLNSALFIQQLVPYLRVKREKALQLLESYKTRLPSS